MSKDKQVATRPASDKAADLKQYRAELERLGDEMRDHTFSFATDNYRDYMIATTKEREFLVRAQRLGLAGIQVYRYWTNVNMTRKTNEVVEQRVTAVRKTYEERIAKLREQFMKPIDYYRERLESHDWTHPMSDDRGVYNAGARNQAKLLEEALEGGEEYKQAFKEAYEKAWSYGNPGTTWSWEKYLMLKTVVRKTMA